jgi:hypothetical protein
MESNERVHVDATEAADRLAILQATRGEVARRVASPWWYHPALGLLLGGLWAAISADPFWITPVAIGVFCVALSALVSTYKRITGTWTNGMRSGRTRKSIRAWLVGAYAVMGATFYLEEVEDINGAMAVGGVLLFLMMWAVGSWWDRLFAAELREGR